MFSTPEAAITGAVAVAIVLSFFLGAVWALQRLKNHRYEQARQSAAYQRAGQTEVLDGSPVAAQKQRGGQ